MTKPKTLDQLQAEKEQAETQLAQEQHKLERLENRKKYLEKGERTKRTHRLCNLGGTIEPCPGGQRSHTHRNDRADGTHLFSVRSPASRPSHGDYPHQPSKQRKGVESRWHYFI